MHAFTSINPYTRKPIYQHTPLSDAALELGANRAHAAHLTWRDTPWQERHDRMEALADALDDQQEALARIATAEMGKPLSESRAEVAKCSLLCRYYAETGARHLAPLTHSDADAQVVYDPLGTFLGIMPWNFPFWQIMRYAVPAIYAGNAALVKPAPNTFACGAALQRLFEQAGFPVGLFQSLVMAPTQTAQLLARPTLHGVSFTGSARGGAAVAALAGQHLKRAVLELGGNDAFIVLEDADVPDAIEKVILSRYRNAGQTCIAAKRLILLRPIAQQALNLLQEAVGQLTLGDPMLDTTDMGPMARPDLVDALDHQVAASIAMGATCLMGGEPIPDSNFYRPTILTDIPKGSPAYGEELFGPVLSVWVVEDEAAAIALANDSSYGLGAAVWSRDLHRAQLIARRLEVGSVVINGLVKSDPRLPFGGIKDSGFGRELAGEGIRAFVNIKTIQVG